MPPPGTHIPSGAARWLPSTVAVTEIFFHVVISGYRMKAVTVKVALTINIVTLVVPGHFFKRMNLKLIFIYVLVEIDITLVVLLLLT